LHSSPNIECVRIKDDVTSRTRNV